jgi:tRNA (guanine37-N1)-methyltransferase
MTIEKNNIWKVNILTLFPEMFPGPLKYSIAGKCNKQSWDINVVNIRDFSHLASSVVDDKPYGGGAGMVMRADIIAKSLDSVDKTKEIIYFSPRGEIFNQKIAAELIKNDTTFICGRYEGIDERVIKHYNIREISIGDFILSGGEIAALTVLDSCIRILPNTMGNSLSSSEESFSLDSAFENLLEYPHYTRPAIWNNLSVPETLLSGHHENIKKWRLSQAEDITKNNRPDLWQKYKKI